ncbi:Catechol 2,3-dioxygenase [Tistlia consotensis]|uniref:Catechol 2,3-dioxygenase n=1 Tax=Tistlia consotensis USBA 355 TaxID=560819 RepID=A0A1Y6B868_9PROT|nr:VOC family protein [Tistlia consotensis]SME97926.1 Catechol 2,3-dioxygenase [Tistlia consotensis USBA 355]SNR57295.1 Catechol 2,3-dioxygenase [Tistlia consotensis]
MSDEVFGAPPKTGWARLVCELVVGDVETSLHFWTALLGFAVAYRRPEEGFVYLERPEGAQIMLCRRNGRWETAALERPHGRGVMFQLYVDSLAPVAEALAAAGWPLYAGPREVWRRHGDREGGAREIFVLDPDGYLVMVAESLGERPLTDGSG